MVEACKWRVDDGDTTVSIEHYDDGTRIEIQQGDDVVSMSATGASPASMVEALVAAIRETDEIGIFGMPDLTKYGYTRDPE